MASIFTKIIQREIPAAIVYEDEWVISFLTIQPIAPGHTLIVPKVEADHFSDVPEPHYSKVYASAKRISKAVHKATGCKRVGQAVVGLEVPHFHLHLIPLNSIQDLDFSKAKPAKPEELEAMKKKIMAQL